MKNAKGSARDEQQPKGELAEKDLEEISGGPISGFINWGDVKVTGTPIGTAITGTVSTIHG